MLLTDGGLHSVAILSTAVNKYTEFLSPTTNPEDWFFTHQALADKSQALAIDANRCYSQFLFFAGASSMRAGAYFIIAGASSMRVGAYFMIAGASSMRVGAYFMIAGASSMQAGA